MYYTEIWLFCYHIISVLPFWAAAVLTRQAPAAYIKEQLKVIATLHTKGFLNEAKFKEQSLEINNKIDKLSKDIRLLSQTEDTTLKDIEMLIDYFEKRKHIMIEFESEAFEFLIDKIVVKDNILEFHIMGGLIFTEEI